MKYFLTLLIALLLVPLAESQVTGAEQSGDKQQQPASTDDVFVQPYFQGNGEDGVYFAWSRDGLKFESLNDGKVVFPTPDWGAESLARDPSIVYRKGVYRMVWSTSWKSRTFGYARSTDLRNWTARKIEIWGQDAEGKSLLPLMLGEDDVSLHDAALTQMSHGRGPNSTTTSPIRWNAKTSPTKTIRLPC